MEWLGIVVALLAGLVLLKKANGWYHERKVEKKKRELLPPGDMGWPFLGNMWSFLRAFKSGTPDAFINGFVKRFGRTGIYRAFMFGSPTILVTVPEICKQVLMDDVNFLPGWPKATIALVGRKSFGGISVEEHKRLRKMTTRPLNGYDALSTHLLFIEDSVVSRLEKWSSMGEIEFLTELRRLTLSIIMDIFVSSEGSSVEAALEAAYTDFNYGMLAMAINLPGFAFYRALKARKKLLAILQSVVTSRRIRRESDTQKNKKDMMDELLDSEDVNGRKLDDEEIIDTLTMYLNAGHEASGHVAMWATIFLQENPEILKKLRYYKNQNNEEQENIRRSMSPTQKRLTLKEVREMEYISKIIDETLRLVNVSSVAFRQATKDTTLNGYTIPKGWKLQVWYRAIHMDPEVYPQPKDFNPSRWDGLVPKAGAFVPFGGGSILCPGKELAKLEISVFLHYFLLNYEMKRMNPKSPIMYLPHPRPKDNCVAKIRRL